jgi:hypothetical protein
LVGPSVFGRFLGPASRGSPPVFLMLATAGFLLDAGIRNFNQAQHALGCGQSPTDQPFLPIRPFIFR